jgi:AraC-like DNA-binding protein
LNGARSALHFCLAFARWASDMATKKTSRYHEVVDRFEYVARANLGKLAHISDFCGVAAVSQRTLLRALQAVYSTTPSRYLRSIRLEQARLALLSRDKNTKTVTQVATRFGFRELGRFAIDYRARYGESPSETLRNALEISTPRSTI